MGMRVAAERGTAVAVALGEGVFLMVTGPASRAKGCVGSWSGRVPEEATSFKVAAVVDVVTEVTVADVVAVVLLELK